MPRWRAAAIERLPELRGLVASADTVMALWIELHIKFEEAYRREPWNDDLIRRIYAYADWCIDAPRVDDAGRDPFTAVIVAFYEDIPAFVPARDDMPRWFTPQEVAQNKAVFSYHIGDAAFADLIAFMHKNRHRYTGIRRQGG